MAEERSARGLPAYLSLWGLLARSSFYKILAVLGLMAAGEGLWLRNILKRGMASESLEIMADNGLPFLFLPALGVLSFFLARTEGLMGDRSRYTMQRLKVDPMQIFALQTVYNVLCITVLYAVQIFLGIWMIEVYGRSLPAESLPSQLLFLAFYRSEFLHCLLPLADTGKWVRNILCILALGMAAAGEGEKKKQIEQILLFIVTASWFATPIGLGYRDVICDMVYGATILGTLWENVFRRKISPEETKAENC